MALERTHPPGARSIPADIESPTAKLVYTDLRANGPASPAELAARLDLQRLTLYPVLETLEAAEHLRVVDSEYRTAT